MSKKTDKAAPPADAEAAPPKKRSKLKLILFALLPLVLAGGGYVGWTQFFAGSAEAAVHGEGEGGEHSEVIAAEPAIPPEVAAATSFTHSYALSVLLEDQCGAMDVPALKAASDEEADADGKLANLSWVTATHRIEALTEQSCGMMRSEINFADSKAMAMAEEKAAGDKGGKSGGGHH
jgi:hypothetical protein